MPEMVLTHTHTEREREREREGDTQELCSDITIRLSMKSRNSRLSHPKKLF